jgi:site-specific recombinase XerD
VMAEQLVEAGLTLIIEAKELTRADFKRARGIRLVMAEQLVEAGLTLIIEAKELTRADFKRARGIRNGLMLALLALCPMRRKNFATLEIGKTFKQVRGRWWVTLPGRSTKMKKPEERPVAEWLNPFIELYLNEARPVLLDGSQIDTNALWISSKTRQPMTARKVGSLITQITRETIGVGISPHMFRTADATTVAEACGDMPHLASALLGHPNSSITEEHYIRPSSLSAATEYANVIERRYFGSRPAES